MWKQNIPKLVIKTLVDKIQQTIVKYLTYIIANKNRLEKNQQQLFTPRIPTHSKKEKKKKWYTIVFILKCDVRSATHVHVIIADLV